MAEAVIKARKTHKRKFNGFDVFIFVFCFLFALICFYPMWYVFIASITPYEVFIKTPALFFPTDFDWSYYQSIFSSAIFQRSISISVFKTVTATALSVFTTSTMAYAVSKKHLKGMKLINFLVVFTMYFNGGLIPTYFLFNDLGMLGTITPMILPAALNISYFIIMRNYFCYSVPFELEEAATIDGANQIIIFFRIVLPVSVPMIAAVSLFIAVAQWNDYYQYMMYVDNTRLQPYVWVLRRMLIDQSMTQSVNLNAQQMGIPAVPATALRMATIITAMLPIMVVYPFLQKHFAQGMMLGAVKG